eukprot:4663050-Amphidinium_carterae.2
MLHKLQHDLETDLIVSFDNENIGDDNRIVIICSKGSCRPVGSRDMIPEIWGGNLSVPSLTTCTPSIVCSSQTESQFGSRLGQMRLVSGAGGTENGPADLFLGGLSLDGMPKIMTPGAGM